MNEFYIDCRQSGKTTKLVDQFIEAVSAGHDVYFFCANRFMCDNVKRMVQQKITKEMRSVGRFDIVNINHWIRTPNEDLYQRLQRNRSKYENETHVFVDEYFFYGTEKLKVLYKLYREPLRKANWVIRSTSNKFYRKDILELVRTVKEYGFPLGKLLPFINDEDMALIDEMSYLLLSEPGFKIIARQVEMEKNLTKEQFEIEMLGRFVRNKEDFK